MEVPGGVPSVVVADLSCLGWASKGWHWAALEGLACEAEGGAESASAASEGEACLSLGEVHHRLLVALKLYGKIGYINLGN